MARPRKHDRPYKRQVSLPSSVDRAVRDTLPRDILDEGPKAGAYSALVEQLLRQWLKSKGVRPQDYRDEGDTTNANY